MLGQSLRFSLINTCSNDENDSIGINNIGFVFHSSCEAVHEREVLYWYVWDLVMPADPLTESSKSLTLSAIKSSLTTIFSLHFNKQ